MGGKCDGFIARSLVQDLAQILRLGYELGYVNIKSEQTNIFFKLMEEREGIVGKVLLEHPGYEPLTRTAEGLGAVVRTFERRVEDGFRISPERVAAAVTAASGACLDVVARAAEEARDVPKL